MRSILSIFLVPLSLYSQSNPYFNVNLQVDYSSAEQIVDLCEGRLHSVNGVADLRGSQLAAATSIVPGAKAASP